MTAGNLHLPMMHQSDTPSPPSDAQPTWNRRYFLQLAGGAAVAVLLGCRPRSAPPAAVPLPIATAPPPTLPTPPPRQIMLTPVSDFYVQQFQSVPQVDAAAWQLTIDGLVDHPLTLDYAAVLSLPRAELMRTLECIGNPVGGNQIGNAQWAGFWLADLLAQVSPQAAARRVRFAAADGYDTSVSLDWITAPNVLMAYEMNGEPLTPAHGFPLRILMPGLYGQKMPKWITRMEFIADAEHLGYWEERGWSNVAAVKTNSQIMSPTHISRLPLDEALIYGVAYAGNRAITRVEIGIEPARGELVWREADLLAGPSSQVWTQFYFPWTPAAPTSYTLYVRASDNDGFTQHEIGRGVLEGAFPDGSDKIHNIVVQASQDS